MANKEALDNLFPQDVRNAIANYVNHTHAIYNYLIANNLYDQKSNGLIQKHYLIQPLIQRLGVFLPFPFLRHQQCIDHLAQCSYILFVFRMNTIGEQYHRTFLCGQDSHARTCISSMTAALN